MCRPLLPALLLVPVVLVMAAPVPATCLSPLRTGAAGFGSATAFPGDLNADGAPDFVVGAGTFEAAGDGVPGSVYVYFGGATTDSIPDVVLTGEANGDRFGYAAAGAGDLNGDGFADLVVGAYRNDAANPDAGRAYVYFGGPGFDTTPDLVLSGTGFNDNFGIAVAGIGDVDADGWDDLLVGARNAGGDESGRAYVFFGGPALDAVADLNVVGQPGERLGFAVARAGDVDADGHADFLVGAYTWPSWPVETGRAYLFFGGPGVDAVADRIFTGDQNGGHFGDALAGADVNGDGAADVVIGASQRAGSSGMAFVYYGGALLDTGPDLILASGRTGDWFGRSVAGGTDVDGDGFGDLLVGAPALGISGNPGRVFVYRGGPAIDSLPDVVLERPGTATFGWSIASGGDVDGDGAADYLAGAVRAGLAFLSPRACVTLTCPSASGTGGTVVQRFCFVNCGFEPRAFTYRADSDSAWCPSESGTVTLAPGEEHCVEILCTPRIACARSSTRFEVRDAACGEILARCTRSVTAPGQRLTVTCPPPRLVDPGDSLSLRFWLHNPGSLAVPAWFGIYDTQNWCADSSGNVLVPAQDSVGVGVDCVVPQGACNIGNSVNFEIYVSCVADGYAGCATSITVRDAPCITLDCPRDTMVVSGASFTRRFCFTNCSADSGIFDYTATGTPGWCAPVAGDVHLAPGETACVPVGCTAPASVDCAAGSAIDFSVLRRDCTTSERSCTARLHVVRPSSAVQSLVLDPGPADTGFGISTCFPGDLNADGHADFAVGAHDFEGDIGPGRVFVYFGGPGADAVPDLVLTGEADGDRFGYAVAGAGDLDGDGSADLAVGAYRNGAGTGRAYVYFGGASMDAVPDVVLSGEVEGDEFGIALDGVGDVDADGWDDLVVGARLHWGGSIGPESGRAYVYFGGPGLDATPDVLLPSTIPGERLGFTVARGGDLNADGHADFLVGAYHSPIDYESGRVYVYFGGPQFDGNASLELYSGGYRAHFGDAVAAADVNGDGAADILVGASQAELAEGRAYVYFGGTGLDPTPDLVLATGVAGDWFGRSISGGADLNGDGHRDFVVGAPGATNGGPGRTWVYLGGPGVDAACDGVLAGEVDGAHFGWSATAGGSDVDGDGAADLLVGAWAHAGTPPRAGRAYLFGRLVAIPVTVLDLHATFDAGRVRLAWGLAAASIGAVYEVRVERAPVEAGPWSRLARLGPEPSMSWEDPAPLPVESWYRLVLAGHDGTLEFAGPVLALLPADSRRTALTAIRDLGEAGIRVTYDVGPRAQHAKLEVFDIAGRRQRVLVDAMQAATRHEVVWDRRGAAGERMARGVYIVRLTAGGDRSARKLVVASP